MALLIAVANFASSARGDLLPFPHKCNLRVSTSRMDFSK